MGKYDCPHCGKFNLRTFCENCGKPTESIWKYRVMFSIGLTMIPLVIWFGFNEINRLLPELVKEGNLEANFAEIVPIILLFALGIAGFSVLHIVWQWIRIECEFKDYRSKNPTIR